MTEELVEQEYEPQLLGTQELLNYYWPAIVRQLERCIDKTMRGEVEAEDIYKAALTAQAVVFIIGRQTVEGPDVKLVVVLEPVVYPRFQAMNILALAGENLNDLHDRYWKALCGWAYMNGARAFEGYVSPAMFRIVSKFGFHQDSIFIRMPLTGE